METYLDDVRNVLPAVDALLSRHEALRLRDYVTRLGCSHTPGFQDNQDFISEVASYTGKNLGPDLAAAIAEDLREMPQVLTANHHGIDTFAQSTQSNLLFSMRKKADGKAAGTIPVLACGSIPLNNLTYPRGLLVYAGSAASADGGIGRLPLFPDSHKRKLVSVAEPFSAEMLSRSRNRSQRLVEGSSLPRSLGQALNAVFDDFASVGHDFPGYSEQATVLNYRIWRRLFKDDVCRSELAYIDLESVVCQLLQTDLFDQSTICHQLMFDPKLRAQLIENLDGERGCWQYEKLLQGCLDAEGRQNSHAPHSAQGTIFFWGVDAKGRKIPLCVVGSENKTGVALSGIDDKGQLWTMPFTPDDVSRGLRDGHLLPSIFTSYLLVSIARGISCIGGYYQADYLPIMQKAVIDTLRSNSGKTVRTFGTQNFRPDLYLSGMQTIGLETEGQLLPAGPLEIIASGGLDAEQYERIGQVTVLQSHIASLYDTIMDVSPQNGELNRSKKEITKLVHDAVSEKIVTVNLN